MKAKPAASSTRLPAHRPLNRLLRDYWRTAESVNSRAFDLAAVEAAARIERARDRAA